MKLLLRIPSLTHVNTSIFVCILVDFASFCDPKYKVRHRREYGTKYVPVPGSLNKKGGETLPFA
jgi:hypothetical protein